MSEGVTKFRPDRTLYLRGFDGRGAAAALHSATPDSFQVSGVFRDAADFAVLVVYDADDFFGHPRIKYLPDFDLHGLVLEFDVHYSGLAPLDTPKFPTIDNTYLDVIRADGTTAQIKLIDYAMAVGAGPAAATAQMMLGANGTLAGDTLRLWFANVNWNYTWGGGEDLSSVGDVLANAINATDWATVGGSYSLTAVNSGGLLTMTASPSGADANLLRMYAVASAPSRFGATPTVAQFAGGSSNVTWHVRLDFSALGIDQVRQAWLTFAPELADSAPYVDSEWEAVFTNWQITADPNSVSALQVAGPGSVRVEESDAWCSFAGSSWQSTDTGWFSQGFAKVANQTGSSVTVTYRCQYAHDLYLGTSLDADCGSFDVRIDGGAFPAVSTYLASGGPIATRRKLASGLTAGAHTVILTMASGPRCFFDFLEAAVPGDAPDAPGAWSDRSPAIDYDTNHGYQLSPARLLWMFDKLGFSGPMNEYIGVFWWNQRKVSGETLASVTVNFAGTFAAGDQIFLTIGGTQIGKTVGDSEDATIWANHFAYFINETFTGVWASASAGTLTITVRSADPAYAFVFNSTWTSSGGSVSWSGSLSGSVPGTWVIDPAQTPALNSAAAAWHADLFAEVKARGNTVTSSFSMELVDTPGDWIARFPDGTGVLTDTGFGGLFSAQCVPITADFLSYQQAAYLHVAQLQAAAGLTPELQFGEFLWWYFANASGMAYYDAATAAAAESALGRALHTFLTPNDDPSVNGYADASFLAARLAEHVAQIVSYVQATYPNAIFELLFPNDVNNASVAPVSKVGGKLNRYVNFPGSWAAQASAPFERLKVEQLAFLTTDRNLDLVKSGLKQMRALAWPADAMRYLYPVDNAGVAQWKEYRAAKAAGFALFTPFAMDHVCLYGWRLDEPAAAVAAQIL